MKNIKVESIDPAAKTVAAGGKTFKYDKLIYALGAYSFVPPFKGHDLDKVVSIRTIEDAAKVKNMVPDIKTAAVIGGGVLGLEAAWALRKAKDWLDARPDMHRLITINSWNEWTETSYLQPDDVYGYGYLDAVKHVFGPKSRR